MQFSYCKIYFERKKHIVLARENYRAVIFYNFNMGFNEEEFLERLQLVHEDEVHFRATVYRWFTELHICHLL